MTTAIAANLKQFSVQLPDKVTLVAVSKTKPISAIQEAYNAGQRIFGENKVQEMTQKWESLPDDIQWHMIGHIQTNKVKYMAPFVSLIHAVDSLKLLKEINKQAKANKRIIGCLLQLKIASEETKFGMTLEETAQLLASEEFKSMENVVIKGLMGMASFTANESQIDSEFKFLKRTFESMSAQQATMEILSMGMSGDYAAAIRNGSTMIRIGSAIFGSRNYH